MYSIVMYGFIGDPCMFVFGGSSCNKGAEEFITRTVAVGLLNVAVFFVSLTYINQSNPSKLKRLSNISTNCAMALLVSIIFIGPRNQGGQERSLLHFGDLILCIALVVVLFLPTYNTSEMAPSNPVSDGLGANPKTFLLFIGIISLLKVIAMSEFMSPTSILADIDSATKLSLHLWQWMVTIVLIIVYPIAFAVIYGDDKDQEVLVVAFVTMIMITLLSVSPISSLFKDGLMTKVFISAGFGCLLGVGAICFGRRSASNRNDYEAV